MPSLRYSGPFAIALCTLVVSLSPHDGFPVDAGASGTVERIDAAVAKFIEAGKVPGVSVATLDRDRVWAKGYGLADVENDVPVTPNTVFRLASVSKPITAVAVMKLVERGAMDLDAPIQKYVAGFPVKEWPVTCRRLLGHIGGIRHYRGDEINSTKHYQDGISPLDVFKDSPLVFEPGSKYLYSTYGYNLLGAAVEGASGRTFMDFVRSEIFEPANMPRTRDDDPYAIIKGRAQGYRRPPRGDSLLNAGLADTSNKIPGGGLCSTASDLANFARALLQGALLKPETRKLMWTSQRTNNKAPTGYGMGFHVGKHSGVREISHGGGQQRVSTLLYIRPDHARAVVILTNLEGQTLVPLAREIADILETP